MKLNRPARKGFTLIELLVVIAIIGLLASIIYANLALARTKAVDAHKKEELTGVRTALQTFNIDYGHMPNNYDCTSGTCVVNPARTTLEIQDMPGAAATESGNAYLASMQELLSAKLISDIPRSPGGAAYVYYNYGPGNSAGALIGTNLASEPLTTTGISGSCRPFNTDGSLSFADSVRFAFAHPISLMAFGGGGGGGVGGGNSCWLLQNGVLKEGPCPPGTANMCSNAASSDYCLCSAY